MITARDPQTSHAEAPPQVRDLWPGVTASSGPHPSGWEKDVMVTLSQGHPTTTLACNGWVLSSGQAHPDSKQIQVAFPPNPTIKRHQESCPLESSSSGRFSGDPVA